MITENLYVLQIAVELKTTPEEAFYIFQKCKIPKTNKPFFNDKDTEDMIKLKKIVSSRELSEIYNLSESAINNRIRKFKKIR